MKSLPAGRCPVARPECCIRQARPIRTGGLDRGHGAVHVAQSLERCLANDRVFTGGDVAFKFVVDERTGGKPLMIAMPTGAGASHHPSGAWAAARKPGQTFPGMRSFTD